MEPAGKTARLAAYLGAIDAARANGCAWSQIAEAMSSVVPYGGQDTAAAERFRRLVVNARKAVTRGRYNPVQRPLPGDESTTTPVVPVPAPNPTLVQVKTVPPPHVAPTAAEQERLRRVAAAKAQLRFADKTLGPPSGDG